jgi:hypothetical protein
MEFSRKSGEDEARINLDVPRGANGGDSAMVLEFLTAMAKAGGIAADLILINCGLHDIKTNPATGAKQIPLDQYRQNLPAIIKVAKRMKLQPVWIRTTPCDEKIHNVRNNNFHRFAADCTAYNAAADEIMRAAGVPSIDLYTFTMNLGPDLYRDHAHFHEPIREKQAAYIAGWLSGYLAGNAGTCT